jgi:hypothetical protein
MKFFVPDTANDEEAEKVYDAIKKFAAQTCRPAAGRKIESLAFRDKGKSVRAEVGKPDPITGEVVFAILETIDNARLYLICTPNRGVRRGEPIYVGGVEVDLVKDFE